MTYPSRKPWFYAPVLALVLVGALSAETAFAAEDPLAALADKWRWRLFENIQVNRGDEVKLVGQADRKEQARLDYIEFIPCGY